MRIWVLSFDGKPIAAAYRFERLNEAMTLYTAAQQARMSINEVEVLT
jgi:hypothetical protein